MREEYNYDSYRTIKGMGGRFEHREDAMGRIEASRKENISIGREEPKMRPKGTLQRGAFGLESGGNWSPITSSTFYGDSGPLLSKLQTVPEELQRYFEIYNGTEGVLGRGAYSSVFKIRSRRSGNIYALKVMSVEHFTCRGLAGQLRREIRLQSQCFHPNIVQLYKSLEHCGYVFLILEYVNTNLFAILHRRKKNTVIRAGARRNRYISAGDEYETQENSLLFTKNEVVGYITQVLKAVNYLHEMNIIHRDIKPENILVSSEGRVKIGDFGWCGDLCRRCTSMAGTFCYMAPEILRGERQTSKVDSWSVGVLLYELFMGNVPFIPYSGRTGNEENSSQVLSMLNSIRDISKESRPKGFPPDAWHLCCWLMRKNPKERASPLQALNHPFLADGNLTQTPPSLVRPEASPTSVSENFKQEAASMERLASSTFTSLPLVAVPTPRKVPERAKQPVQIKRMITEIPVGFIPENNHQRIPQNFHQGPHPTLTRQAALQTEFLQTQELPKLAPGLDRSRLNLQRRDLSRPPPAPKDAHFKYLQNNSQHSFHQFPKAIYPNPHSQGTVFDRGFRPQIPHPGTSYNGGVVQNPNPSLPPRQDPPSRYLSQPPVYFYDQQSFHTRRNHYA
ncbi:protein kinase domain-containing protein [Cryptosporidium felis]|nr:protein kinase domain-containing protein [Cryptosporidium felis]